MKFMKKNKYWTLRTFTKGWHMYNSYINETLTKIVVDVNTAVSNTWHVASPLAEGLLQSA